jgi:RES domain-containing protein
MIVFRVTPAEYAHSLEGIGARRNGGRWNRKGTAVLYTSNSTALCLLEILVNVKQRYFPTYHRMVVEVPDDLVNPAPPVFFTEIGRSTEYGEHWVNDGRWAAIKVASSILLSSQDAFNILINPAHRDFAEIKLLESSPLTIDTRLLSS